MAKLVTASLGLAGGWDPPDTTSCPHVYNQDCQTLLSPLVRGGLEALPMSGSLELELSAAPQQATL